MLVPFFRSAVTSLLSKKMMLGFLVASWCVRERVLCLCI